MEKILNQEEIDALFHAAQDRAGRRRQAEGQSRPVTACNFRRAGMMTRDQLSARQRTTRFFCAWPRSLTGRSASGSR